MQNEKLSEHLTTFIDHVQRTRANDGRDLTVLDLRLECRDQRLTEYSDWSTNDLDTIEQEAVSYGDETHLAHVISGGATATAIPAESWLHSPSPVAWT